MTERETMEFTIDFTALQQKLAAKEAECKELCHQLHELRGRAQFLQSKLAVAELVLEEERRQRLPSLTSDQIKPSS